MLHLQNTIDTLVAGLTILELGMHCGLTQTDRHAKKPLGRMHAQAAILSTQANSPAWYNRSLPQQSGPHHAPFVNLTHVPPPPQPQTSSSFAFMPPASTLWECGAPP